MNVTLWGTRGSLATPGPETVRYGGNTSCVEVRGADDTLLVIDAGTGIRRLGASIPAHKRVDLLLSHLHMDHIQGLGFFKPLDQPGQEVHIWGPPSTTLGLRERLSRYLSPPLFPVRLRDLPCNLTLHEIPPDGFEIGGLKITASLICHPGPTVGYRISENGTSVAYLSDHEPALGRGTVPEDSAWTSGFEIAADSSLLIHDAQYDDAEYDQHVGWGHSAISHTFEFARRTGTKHLVTFHHDPAHDDATLDRMLERNKQADLTFEVSAGTEGATFRF